MDVENRRPQLPALSYLDVDKVNREEEAAYQKRNSGAANTLPPVTAASPTYPPAISRSTIASICHEAILYYGAPPPQTYQPFQHARPEPHPHTYPPQEAQRAPYGPERPPSHLPGSESAARPTQPAPTYPYPPTATGGYDHPPPHPAGSMPPPSSVPYGYIPYPARYSQPTPQVSGSSGPIYQPSAHYPATPAPGWKAEVARYGPDDATDSRDYSTSVKRHLDMYDLEGSLNEIAQSSGILLDFSRRYGDRLHQSARSGPSLATLPGLVEVEDMINKSRVQLESLEKIRAVVLEQQAAYEQSIVDQRQAHKGNPEIPPTLAQTQEDEAKADMSSQDNKKRLATRSRWG
ncbi:Glutamate-cysteine ligase [Teratosphaeria destructans]|uniref:Glutamate-cysteine ligase n=1 Tax=Teratosphaeria destructans TaxID=418781 RepID=A0A9W7VZH2_9PEZI|nr:Glutamate-cysteine ligase [Teratosphaeria destructans]